MHMLHVYYYCSFFCFFVMSRKRKAEPVCCPICLSDVENVATLDCMHTFCSTCIIRHLRTDKRCPVCRHVPTDDEHGGDTLEDAVHIAAMRLKEHVPVRIMRQCLRLFDVHVARDATTEEIADMLSEQLHYETDTDDD